MKTLFLSLSSKVVDLKKVNELRGIEKELYDKSEALTKEMFKVTSEYQQRMIELGGEQRKIVELIADVQDAIRRA